MSAECGQHWRGRSWTSGDIQRLRWAFDLRRRCVPPGPRPSRSVRSRPLLPRLITQRSQVRILPPLQYRRSSEALPRREGPLPHLSATENASQTLPEWPRRMGRTGTPGDGTALGDGLEDHPGRSTRCRTQKRRVHLLMAELRRFLACAGGRFVRTRAVLPGREGFPTLSCVLGRCYQSCSIRGSRGVRRGPGPTPCCRRGRGSRR